MIDYTDLAQKFLAKRALIRGEIPKISDRTGIPKPWLYKVAQGKIPNPQANRVMTIINYKNEVSTQKVSSSND